MDKTSKRLINNELLNKELIEGLLPYLASRGLAVNDQILMLRTALSMAECSLTAMALKTQYNLDITIPDTKYIG